ncbi:MAG: hypothetical protein ABIK37_07150 [candidate division WOR-3 bacterium]
MRWMMLLGSLLLPLVTAANPIMTVVFSEVQVAPDSLERLELHPYSWAHGFPYDLGGAQVITRAGTAVVNSGVVFENESSYVVLDRSNLTGTFSLGDTGDLVRFVLGHDLETLSVAYPGNPYRSHERSFVPPAGMSAAVYQWWEGVYPDLYDVYTWYLDSTPTFGAANDDNAGGVFGTVRDDDSVGLAGATVTLSGPNGAFQMTTWSGYPSPYGRGYYFQKPTGPGRFWMSVTLPDYLPWSLAESLELGANELRQIDVVLVPDTVGVEEQAARTQVLQVAWRKREIIVHAAEPARAAVGVFGSDGRLVWQNLVVLERGANALALVPKPPAGVYLVSVRSGAAAFGRKVVIF